MEFNIMRGTEYHNPNGSRTYSMADTINWIDDFDLRKSVTSYKLLSESWTGNERTWGAYRMLNP